MFKTSHLDISKFDFLLLCLFHTENLNGMPILPITPKLKLHRFENDVILELRVKLTFFVRNEQRERKSKFNTPK